MAALTLKRFLLELAEERKLDLRGYKLSSLERRFRHRMSELKMGSFEQYAAYIAERPEETANLLNAVLINVTQFFRDARAWETLRQEVLPELCGRVGPGETFRAWSAGCASGEEAYSLAILLSEQMGERLGGECGVKIYATDIDEDALNTARKGEYSAEKLRHVPPEWRQKYFEGGPGTARISRELRRLVIFGRANLASDAPIPRVRLLLCRNMLIYCDLELQAQIMERLHYALEPGGVLMLGRAESQLTRSTLFRPLYTKWRLFERLDGAPRKRPRSRPPEESKVEMPNEENELLKLYHEAVLATVEPGVLILDTRNIIITENEQAARLLDFPYGKLTGKKVSETPLFERCPELASKLESMPAGTEEKYRSECSIGPEGKQRTVAVTLKAIVTETGERAGTLVYVEDVTTHYRLQATISELETTAEELQSTNEELETTNEELQSANEEMETTNEELQSANEELETTNEELQALNEELGTTNEELEVRTRELDEMNSRYVETLGRIPLPVLLVGGDSTLQFWNTAATRMFGLEAKSVVGLQMAQLPVPERLRRLMAQQAQIVSATRQAQVLRNRMLQLKLYRGTANLHFTPLAQPGSGPTVLVLFEPYQSVSGMKPEKAAGGARRTAKKKSAGAAKKKKPAKTKRK